MSREWLIKLRTEKSQKEIGRLVGISQQMYSAIEKGRRDPSVSVAKEIASILDFDWTKFFEDEKENVS